MTTEPNPEAKSATAKTGGNGKRRKALMILATAVVVLGIAWLLYHFLYGRWHEDTNDAYVQGNVVTVTPQVGGTVVGITVDDGMRVEAGQVLVRFDHSDTDVAYQQAVQLVLAAQRSRLVELRNEGVISNEVMNRVMREFDLEESRLEI